MSTHKPQLYADTSQARAWDQSSTARSVEGDAFEELWPTETPVERARRQLANRRHRVATQRKINVILEALGGG